MPASPCPAESRLLEYVDGLLPEPARLEVAAHLETCGSCRAVLTALVPEQLPQAQPVGSLDLLHHYLKEDAGHRELSVNRFVRALCLGISGVVVVSMAIFGVYRYPVALVAAVLVFFALELIARQIRRGRYRPALSYAGMLVEGSFIPGFLLVLSELTDPLGVLGSPVAVMWGVVVVLSAARMMPAVCLGAGVFAASASVALHLKIAPSLLAAPPMFATPRGAVMRAVFLLAAGGAGALLARELIRHAERALSATRAQELFGKYLLHELLGAGGMGEVYRATYCPEGGFLKTVAVKRLLPELASDERFLEVFRDEARLGSRLVHRNVVQVLDCGRYRDTFVIAMEHVDGVSLQALLRAGPLPVAAVCHLGAELAAALDYIHTRRDADGRPLELVHRDVNPPNVLLSRAGEVKLTDFGVARARSRATLSADRMFVGKDRYAAPEHRAGSGVDGRADLYGLGCVLYQALVGLEHAPQPSARPSQHRASVPQELDRLVGELLAPEADGRPGAAAQVRERLQALDAGRLGELELQAAVRRSVAANHGSPARAGPRSTS